MEAQQKTRDALDEAQLLQTILLRQQQQQQQQECRTNTNKKAEDGILSSALIQMHHGDANGAHRESRHKERTSVVRKGGRSGIHTSSSSSSSSRPQKLLQAMRKTPNAHSTHKKTKVVVKTKRRRKHG
eukprot:scaffold49775_cov71-Attheya_sp.AAC.1